MFTKFKNSFIIISLLCCYPLYSVGQLWLFFSQKQEADFYENLTKHTGDWVNTHLILMAAVMLMIPAYWAVSRYLSDTKHGYLAALSTFFISLSTFVLFGQFTIDLCLVDIFSLPKEQAYAILDKIQENWVTKALFYDNSQLFFLLKYFDFALIGQLLLGFAMVLSKKIPKWAWILFFVALVLTQVGIALHPVYGRILKRSSYALWSVAFLPIVMDILRKNFQKDPSV
jgi:hypothetical protein